jgi:polysaccharide biosynthesis transport protein
MSFTGDVMHGQATALRSYGDPPSPQVEAPIASSYGNYQSEEPARDDGLHSLWLILSRERVRALTIMLVALVAGAASIWLTAPVYSARATLQIDSQSSRILRDESIAPKAESTEDDRAFRRQVDLLASRGTAENVANNLNVANDPLFLREVGLENQPAGSTRTAKVASALQNRLSVSSPRHTDIVTIRFDSHDPVTAARIANTFAETFARDSLERQLFGDDFSRRFRRGQLELAKVRLKDAERSLLDYAASFGLFDGADAAGLTGTGGELRTGTAARRADLNDAYSKAQANLVEAEQRWQQAISRPQIGNSVSIVDRAEPPARPAYPRPAMNLALAALLGALALGADIARSRMDKRAHGRGDVELDFDAPSLAVVPPSPSSQTADGRMSDTVNGPGDLERDFDAPSLAVVPPSPSSQTADGRMSGTVNGPGDLERDFDAPLLGIVPLPRDGEDFPLAMLDPPRAAAVAHHAIFLALDEIVRTADHRVLLLTSSSHHEGKSMIAVRLSASFAGAGKKVLMIDADMHRGSLHRMLGLSNRLGLADLLAADSTDELTNVAQHCAVPGFSVVPRGEPAARPAELLASKRFADLLDEAVDLYDVVIMDGPPALGLVDAPCLSGMADATVFVVQANRTPREDAKLAIRRLSEAGAGQIGLVISTCDSAKDFGVMDHARSYNHAAGMAEQFVAEEPPRAEPAPAHLQSLDRNAWLPDPTS